MPRTSKPTVADESLDIQKRCLSELRRLREDNSKMLEKVVRLETLVDLLSRVQSTPPQPIQSYQEPFQPGQPVIPNAPVRMAPAPGLLHQRPVSSNPPIQARRVTPIQGTRPQSGVARQPKPDLGKEGALVTMQNPEAIADAMAFYDNPM